MVLHQQPSLSQPWLLQHSGRPGSVLGSSVSSDTRLWPGDAPGSARAQQVSSRAGLHCSTWAGSRMGFCSMCPCGQPSLAPPGQPCAGDQTRSCGGIPVRWLCHGPVQHHIICRQARCQISSPAGDGAEEMVLSPVCAPVRGSALCLHSISCSEMRLSLPSSWATGWPLSRVSCTGKTFSSCSVGCWVSGLSPGSPASISFGTRRLEPVWARQ